MNTDKCNSVKTVKSILLQQENDITNSTPIYYKPSKELIDTITPLLLLTLISNISKIYKTIYRIPCLPGQHIKFYRQINTIIIIIAFNHSICSTCRRL